MFRNFYRTSLILAVLWVASGGPAVCRADTLEIGSPAPDFRLPGVDGKTYSLESFRDAEVLVVVFTCNHCPTAQAYEGRIQQLAADYKDKKVRPGGHLAQRSRRRCGWTNWATATWATASRT